MICLLHLLQNQPNDGQASLLSTDGTSTPEIPYVEDMTSREEHAQQVCPCTCTVHGAHNVYGM